MFVGKSLNTHDQDRTELGMFALANLVLCGCGAHSNLLSRADQYERLDMRISRAVNKCSKGGLNHVRWRKIH